MTEKTDNPLWMSGNEAIALAAHEAGVKVASGYPGTPSTEILENFSRYEGVYSEWAPNEKVGLEVAIGASFAGVRALATMKHVGLNVAADPLFTASYTGVRGGLVVIVADDPEMHSSQNEQDSRNYAFAAKLPMLEPSDPAEAKELLKLAFAISEQYDTPVLFRTTTRIAHVKGVITKGEMLSSLVTPGIEKMPAKFVMLPGNARARRVVVDELWGQWITLLPLAASDTIWIIPAFVFFRLFDITKPWPVKASERWLPGGWGIMIDDGLAGLYAMMALLACRAMF